MTEPYLYRWKSFLSESKEQTQIYCDMDGVLCDFESAVVEQINSKFQRVASAASRYQEKNKRYFTAVQNAAQSVGGDLLTGKVPTITRQQLWQPGDDSGRTENKAIRRLMYILVSNYRQFWKDIPWTSDGKKLWEYISKFEPVVLSSPMRKNSELGKQDWCREQLELPENKVILTQQKAEHVHDFGKTGLIIDDMRKNCEAFIAAGGKAIQHKSAEESIRLLKEKGF